MKRMKFVIILIGIIFTYSFGSAKTAYAGLLYTFDPIIKNYELYENQLVLFNTEETGYGQLYAPTNNYDKGTLRAWFGAIIAAQAMGKKIEVHYDPSNGRILSVYGPK
jgi:hypothetical protein